MSGDTTTERLRLTTDDAVGLEAELRVPAEPWGAAVVLHPHPRQGGTMHSLVCAALFDALPASGVAALRFNFRGVGESDGSHGRGRDEAADVRAALDALFPVIEGVPVITAGWSFGADVSLSVTDERIDGWLAVAPPLRVLPIEDLAAGHDPRPKVLAVPQHDEFCPPGAASAAVQSWVNTRVEVVPGANHFLVGRTDRVAALAVELLEDLRG